MRAGRWELVRLLGSGGMGEVWLGRDPARSAEAAVKLLSRELDADLLLRFDREARALRELHHPGVVGWIESGRSERGPWIAMELCPGGSLEARVRASGPLPPREAVESIREVCAAVGASHRAGVLHRDLKPSNVLFDGDGRPRLTDFGLARPIARGASLTATGAIMGTPGFLAPEQVSGDKERIGWATDVYGLGATLYYLLTGVPPFAGKTVVAGLEAVLHDAPRPPSALRPDLPPSLDALVLRCLAKSPGERYPDAASLEAALEGWLTAPTRRAARWPAMVLLLFLGMAVAGAIVAWRNRRVVPPRPAAPGGGLQDRPRRAKELLGREQPEPALVELERAVELDPTCVEALLLRSAAKQNLGRLDEALADLDRAIALDPGCARAFRNRGRIHLGRGDYQNALTNLELGLQRGTDDAEVHFTIGGCLLNLGRPEEALAAASRALHHEPDAAQVLVLRGDALSKLDRFEAAIEAYGQAIAADPKVPNAHAGRATVRARTGRLVEALADFDQALELNPHGAEVLHGRAGAKSVLGREREALEDIDSALAIDPENAGYHATRGILRLRLGQPEAAIEAFDQAIALEPRNVRALGQRGAALARLGRPQEALGDLDQALALDPEDGICLAERGMVHALRGGNPRQAVDDLVRALPRAAGPKERSQILAHLGVAHRDLGEDARAFAELEEALRLDPGNGLAMAQRGMAHQDQGRTDAAIADLERAVTLEPDAWWAPIAQELRARLEGR